MSSMVTVSATWSKMRRSSCVFTKLDIVLMALNPSPLDFWSHSWFTLAKVLAHASNDWKPRSSMACGIR